MCEVVLHINGNGVFQTYAREALTETWFDSRNLDSELMLRPRHILASLSIVL
jgi:hypothetical protein